MSQISDEIKSKIDLVDLISEYIQLKPGGANFKAPCPFHHEKTPSFMVSRPKQIWHCFGCGEGGDIFGFIMKMEGLEFPEALRLLAEKAGVKLPAYSSELSSSVRNRLLDAVKLAAKFYHKVLLDSPKAQAARDYLAKRGVAPETIDDFQIGFIPDPPAGGWDILTKFLLKKGFGINDLMAAGLTIKKEGGGNYDRFRGRIMFPLSDAHGNVVGFTGRLLDESKAEAGGPPATSGQKDQDLSWRAGKYVNTPQTPIYDKSKIIFALDKAKLEIKRQDRAIMVEGQMDVLACHQAGQTNVVASSGTALTLEQVKLLKRFTNNLYIAFDADPAGQNAAERGIDVALAEGTQIKVIRLPAEAGKDPDECLKKNPELWFKAVEGAESIMDYLFQKTLAGQDLSQPGPRSQAAKTLLLRLAKIPDVIERDFWLKKLANILDIEISLLRERLADLKKQAPTPRSSGETSQTPSPARERREAASERLLSLVLCQPDILKITADRLKPEALSAVYQAVFRDYLLFINQTGPAEDIKKVIHSFKDWTKSKEACQIVDILELLYEQEFADFSQEQLLAETLNLINSLNLWYTEKNRRELEKQMKEAEQKGDKEKISELMKKFYET